MRAKPKPKVVRMTRTQDSIKDNAAYMLGVAVTTGEKNTKSIDKLTEAINELRKEHKESFDSMRRENKASLKAIHDRLNGKASGNGEGFWIGGKFALTRMRIAIALSALLGAVLSLPYIMGSNIAIAFRAIVEMFVQK